MEAIHLDHKNILHLGRGRPFPDIETHNEALVDNWNSVVKSSDRVYFLGDFSFGPQKRADWYASRLNGRKYWILGNHDMRHGSGPTPEVTRHFEWVGLIKTVTVEGHYIVLCHYPFLEWDRAHKGSWHLHGHQHGNGAVSERPRLDVGVDCFNYKPVSFNEIAEILSKRAWGSTSHH